MWKPPTLRKIDGCSLTSEQSLGKGCRKEFPSDALTRLYALGLDAFRAAQALRDTSTERVTFEGATGKVTLVEGRQFQREGVFAVLRAGQLAPLDGAR